MAPSAADRHASRFEPRLAVTVGARAALRGLDVDGTADRIELGERRQTTLVELHRGDRADGGDELTRGHARRTRLQRRDRIGNREDVLERRVPPGPVADEHDVIVRVDEAGNDRPAFEVHDGESSAAPNDVVADGGKAAVPNEDLGDDATGAIHRVDAPVDEGRDRVHRSAAV